jgi:putative ABC transport system permease protein
MFFRLVTDSFRRRPRHKFLTGAALALGMAVATAALSVSLDVGDRLAREFRSLGANLVVTPQADSLPLEIGGVDYRPVNAGAYLPESDLPKLKTIFWRNNIVGFAPVLEVRARVSAASSNNSPADAGNETALVGTWANHTVTLPEGKTVTTGIEQTNPWWHVEGAWFADNASECVVGSTLAAKSSVRIGDELSVRTEKSSESQKLRVVGILSTGGPEDQAVLSSLSLVQRIIGTPGKYRKLYVSAITKPEDDLSRRDPRAMTADEMERWSCSPYVSSIAYSIRQVLPGTDVRVIRRVAEGEGKILAHVKTLLWMVTFAALLAAGLAVGASSAASVIERRAEIGLMKALGAGSGKVGILLAAEQLLLALVGGALGYAIGAILAHFVGQSIFGAAPAPSFFMLALILVLAALITLLGSAIPLRRAARYEPAPILRGE